MLSTAMSGIGLRSISDQLARTTSGETLMTPLGIGPSTLRAFRLPPFRKARLYGLAPHAERFGSSHTTFPSEGLPWRTQCQASCAPEYPAATIVQRAR